MLSLFVGLVLLSASAYRSGAFEDARELASACQQIDAGLNPERKHIYIPNAPGTLECWGYFQAVQSFVVLIDEDGNRIIGACAPEKTTLLELINKFLAYTREHPGESKASSTAVVVIRAMQEAYPCRDEAAKN
jgi:Rap1a immunity proteins